MEQISIFDYECKEYYKIKKPIRLIELFAGVGSQAMALRNIGANFEHYRVCEFDKYAIKSYNAIHRTNFVTSDITQLSGKDLGIEFTDEFDYILTYSFPCQDLSVAGKCKGMDKGGGTRSGLLWEVERLLEECKELPQVLLMENVTQVHGKKNINNFNKWIQKLESLGYKNYWKDLNSKNYGIPQNRNRCFMVSILGDYLYDFNLKEKSLKHKNEILENNVNIEYYNICDSMKNAYKIGKSFIYKDISHSITTSQQRWNNTFVEEDIKVFQLAHGYNKGGEKIGVPTITKSSWQYNNYLIVNNTILRYFTPKECWRLMGFNDEDFEKASKVVSNTQLYKQAGNAIVVPVLEEIFKNLLN